jgi:hypothetical protein
MNMFDRDELLRLLRRDHRELEMSLIELVAADLSFDQRRQILDGARLGLEAHGAAEDIVVYPAFERIAPVLAGNLPCQLELARAAHQELDGMLGAVLRTPVGRPTWFELVHMLRIRAEAHAAREENELIPRLRAGLPAEDYLALAGAFATERLKQLAMLQPSAPIAMPVELIMTR